MNFEPQHHRSPVASGLPCFPPLFDRVLVLAGPTASGKTELAIRVAEAMRPTQTLEIVSLDSMAVYRGMDIGTAKPSKSDQQRATHHLIDIVDPWEEFSVAEYLSAAHAVVQEILDRGNRPMFVGGTPMYLKAILRGFDPGPPADEAFRQSVMADVQRHGIEALRRRLQQVDPLSAARIDAGDVRRMIRALEFAKATGVPISHRQQQFEIQAIPEEGYSFALQTPRPILHQRIARRVSLMFDAGLVDEVRRLQSSGHPLSKTARQGVGYREVIEQLERAAESPFDGETAAEQVLFHTRRLARRQETWLRSFSELRPIRTHDQPAEAWVNRPIEQLVDEIVAVLS